MTVVVRRDCADAAEARALHGAVAADNPSFVEVSVQGRQLEIRVRATSAASARSTLEDLMACLQAAERARKSGPSGPDPSRAA